MHCAWNTLMDKLSTRQELEENQRDLRDSERSVVAGDTIQSLIVTPRSGWERPIYTWAYDSRLGTHRGVHG